MNPQTAPMRGFFVRPRQTIHVFVRRGIVGCRLAGRKGTDLPLKKRPAMRAAVANVAVWII
ncbi:MAG: hypothetical protein RL272_868 [Candidatus Parcubacteria bacterium]|jgi:hypothetical protein